MSENVLHVADRITAEDRQRYYGHPIDNHGCTAVMQRAYIDRRRQACQQRGEEFVLDVRDVCWLNVLQKASRDANQRQEDNLVDGAGYLRNAQQAEQEAKRRAELLGPVARPAIYDEHDRGHHPDHVDRNLPTLEDPKHITLTNHNGDPR